MMVFILLFFTAIFIFPLNSNAETFVNSQLNPNLQISDTTFYRYNTQSSYVQMSTGYSSEYESDVKYYYTVLENPIYNNIGFGIVFPTPYVFGSDQRFTLTDVVCATTMNVFYGDSAIATSILPSFAMTSAGSDIISYSESNIGSYSTLGFDFERCVRFDITFRPNSRNRVGNYIQHRIMHSEGSTQYPGILAFMGYNISNVALDFTSDFNRIEDNINSKSNQILQAQQETQNAVNNVDDTLKDDNVDNPDFDEFEDMMAENGVITNLMTLPITLYSKILLNVNSTCVDFSLGSLWGSNLTMTCIKPQDYLGTTLWNTIDVLFSGFFIYYMGKKFIKVFQNFTNLEEGDVLDD